MRAEWIDSLVVFLPSLGWGGVEKHTADLVVELKLLGVKLSVVGEGSVIDGFKSELDGVDCHRLKVGFSDSDDHAKQVLRQRHLAADVIRSVKPDFAIIPLCWPSFGAGLQEACGVAKIPTISIAHLAPNDSALRAGAEIRSALKLLEGKSHLWVAVSAVTARHTESFLGLKPLSVRLIQNGVRRPSSDVDNWVLRAELRDRLGLDASQPICLFVGRDAESKGADLLGGLAFELRQVGVRLYWVGVSGHEGLSQRSKSNHQDIRFVGWIDDVRPWLAAADVLVMPSRLEGCSLVLLEAGAMGCPVVATRAAVESMGEFGDSICFVCENDVTAEELKSSVVNVLKSNSLARFKVSMGLQFNRYYSDEDMLRRYISMIRFVAMKNKSDLSDDKK